MIQRIQSLYLAIALILMLFVGLFPILHLQKLESMEELRKVYKHTERKWFSSTFEESEINLGEKDFIKKIQNRICIGI